MSGEDTQHLTDFEMGPATTRKAAAAALDATMAVTGEATLTELEANPGATVALMEYFCVKTAGLDVARLARALEAEWPYEEEPDYFAQKARDVAREYGVVGPASDAPEPVAGEPLTETEALQDFAARHGIPLPKGLHIDSNLVGPKRPSDAPEKP